MEPITDYFEKFKAELSEFIFTREYYKVDLDEPENIHLQNIITDQNIIWEGYRFNLNGNELNGLYFHDLVKQTQGEIASNLEMPIDHQDQIAYLDEIIEFSSKIEESIVKKAGRWTHSEGKHEGFIYDELPDYEKESLSNGLKEFKNAFRDLIVFIKAKLPIEKQINHKIQSGLLEPAEQKQIRKYHSFELSPFFIRNIDCFKKFAGQLAEDKFIESTGKNKMLQIFSGKPVKEPVVWTGDKGALKYLIKQLKKYGIFKKHKAFWITTSKCFKYENESINSYELSTENFPTRPDTLAKLDSVINILVIRQNTG